MIFEITKINNLENKLLSTNPIVTPNLNDETLIKLSSEGNKEAFGILIKKYLPKGVSFAYKIVGEQAQDAVQDAFIKIWRYSPVFDEKKAKFSTWFYKILTNTCYSILKKNKYFEDINDYTEELSNKDSPETDNEQRESQENLKKLIKSLSEVQQKVLILTYYQGLSNKETSEILGLTVKSVESHLVRIRRKLNHDFKKKYN